MENNCHHCHTLRAEAESIFCQLCRQDKVYIDKTVEKLYDTTDGSESPLPSRPISLSTQILVLDINPGRLISLLPTLLTRAHPKVILVYIHEDHAEKTSTDKSKSSYLQKWVGFRAIEARYMPICHYFAMKGDRGIDKHYCRLQVSRDDDYQRRSHGCLMGLYRNNGCLSDMISKLEAIEIELGQNPVLQQHDFGAEKIEHVASCQQHHPPIYRDPLSVRQIIRMYRTFFRRKQGHAQGDEEILVVYVYENDCHNPQQLRVMMQQTDNVPVEMDYTNLHIPCHV